MLKSIITFICCFLLILSSCSVSKSLKTYEFEELKLENTTTEEVTQIDSMNVKVISDEITQKDSTVVISSSETDVSIELDSGKITKTETSLIILGKNIKINRKNTEVVDLSSKIEITLSSVMKDSTILSDTEMKVESVENVSTTKLSQSKSKSGFSIPWYIYLIILLIIILIVRKWIFGK